MSALGRLAADAPVPVFAAVGAGCLDAVERLLARPGLAGAASPRQAAILLVAGDVPEDRTEALDRLHDQVPPPRRVVRWDGAGDPEPEMREAWRALCLGAESAPDRLLDAPPNPWRGRGDHGQGGEGMMGGVPYGRPMAMTDADIRDGLQLDSYTARIGPFAPMLPPGLELEATFQGDVIVACAVRGAPFPQPEAADAPGLCAARMLRLLGLGLAADRIAAGHSARAPFAAAAVPPGLAALEGAGDARTRLRGWLRGRACPGGTGLFDALRGLDWAEAALALASVAPSDLRRDAGRALARQQGDSE